jgi:hypothetical protein
VSKKKKTKVSIALDQARQLKFSVNAMCELEERFGESMPVLFSEGKVGFSLIVAVLRIGLIHGGMKIPGNPKSQELFVGDLIQEHWIDEGNGLDELMEKVTTAFNAAGIFTSKADKEEADDENPPLDTVDETETSG